MTLYKDIMPYFNKSTWLKSKYGGPRLKIWTPQNFTKLPILGTQFLNPG